MADSILDALIPRQPELRGLLQLMSIMGIHQAMSLG